MRVRGCRVAAVAVLIALAAVVLGGCELREGDPREYGNPAGRGGVSIGFHSPNS